jgi:hypothetical protein
MATVGGNQGATVMGNDSTTVNGYQTLDVAKDRKVHVVGAQGHQIDGTMAVQCEKDIVTMTPNGAQSFSAHKSLTISVGQSTIIVQPEAIVINSKDVYINPGDDFVAQVAAGKPAKQVAEEQDKQEKAQAAAAADAKANAKLDQSFGGNVPPEVAAAPTQTKNEIAMARQAQGVLPTNNTPPDEKPNPFKPYVGPKK